MHEKNIKKVQIETVKIITETEKTIESLIEIEKKIKSEDRDEAKTLSYMHLTEHQGMLKNDKQKLDDFEYVIAVVGTMKAGKSMTINAIVGQEVLPSREFPMTTLPTLITHKPKQEEPILNLTNIEPFQKLVEEVKEKIETSKTSEQRDLNSLIDEIKNSKISFKKTYEGQEQIESFLKQINDLMRIAKDFGIEPPYNDFTNVNDLPRIEVEFYHLSKEENNSNAKLTLLDTPGPDEFKHSILLKEIFKNQLQRASAVMLLVDYTKMNSQSDVEVKEQVKDVANMIGKQHLFVLLNKFDQRKRSDGEAEKKEEAKRLIAEDVLKDQIDKNNIYPISAKSAFYANFGLRELEKNGKIDTSLNWIDDFGNEVLGRRWEKYIQDEEEVREACSDAWDDSFFEEPLENIISTIHGGALFLSLKSPLDKLDNLLREYGNAFKSRQSALKQSLGELKETIENLKMDIENLSNISEDIGKNSTELLTKVEDEIKTKIEDKIKLIEMKTIEDFDKQIDSEYEVEKNQGHNVKNNRKLWDGGMFDLFKNDDKKRKNFKEEGKTTFDNEEDAEKFLKPIKKLIDENVKNIHDGITKQTNENLEKLANRINKNIHNELKDILEEIEKKLSEDEENKIEIQFPELSIGDSGEIDFDINETVENKEVKKTRVKDSFFFGKVPNFFSSDWGKETYTEKSYVVSKENIQHKIKEQFNVFKDALIDNLNNEFNENIKIPLEDKLRILMEAIEGYRHEQIGVSTAREKEDKKNIVEMIENNSKFIRRINTLDKRVKVAKRQFGEDNE